MERHTHPSPIILHTRVHQLNGMSHSPPSLTLITLPLPLLCTQVPPKGKGSLYLRPLLMGTGAILGLGPAPSYTFAIFGAAVGAYFKGGQLTPINLVVEERFHRAAPGGMGGTKAAGNYSPVRRCSQHARMCACCVSLDVALHGHVLFLELLKQWFERAQPTRELLQR